MPFSSGFPKEMSNNPPTDRIVPERPPVEIASAVNNVFIEVDATQRSGAILWGEVLLPRQRLVGLSFAKAQIETESTG